MFEIGTRLCKLREQQGWTTEQVLDLTKQYTWNNRPKSRMWLWRIEKGNLKKIKKEDLEMLVKIYSTTMDYVLEGVPADVDAKFLQLYSKDVVKYISNPKNQEKVEQVIQVLIELDKRQKKSVVST